MIHRLQQTTDTAGKRAAHGQEYAHQSAMHTETRLRALISHFRHSGSSAQDIDSKQADTSRTPRHESTTSQNKDSPNQSPRHSMSSRSSAHTPSQRSDHSSLSRFPYTVKERLGGGSFGEVHVVTDQDGNRFAAKFERKKLRQSQLLYEARVLKSIEDRVTRINNSLVKQSHQYRKQVAQHGLPEFIFHGVPRVYFTGTHDDKDVMVMQLLGKDLGCLLEKCGGKFSLKTVCMIAIQLLDRVEVLHRCGFIHRDIKPNNFVLGEQNSDQEHLVYLIDFGLSKRYEDHNGEHIPYRANKHPIGTIRYTSINNHMGIEQSRRDDLESIGYMLIYFVKGCLPWQGEKVKDKMEQYARIAKVKMETPIETLCDGLPKEFVTYMTYVRNLGFEKTPRYGDLRILFWRVLESLGHHEFDFVYDWSCL